MGIKRQGMGHPFLLLFLAVVDQLNLLEISFLSPATQKVLAEVVRKVKSAWMDVSYRRKQRIWFQENNFCEVRFPAQPKQKKQLTPAPRRALRKTSHKHGEVN